MQALPSLQGVPVSGGFEHRPVLALHTRVSWHWSGLGQVPATQVPDEGEQLAHPEHALPAFCQAPFVSHACGCVLLHW